MDSTLKECVNTLKPYLNQLVLAGGWVPYVYGKMYIDAVVYLEESTGQLYVVSP